jgi:four helix bundle protein
MKIEKFEDLDIWNESRKFAADIYKLTLGESFKRDYGLREQIQRAAVSILSNIAEGFERENNKEFINFLKYAKGSAGEVRAQLHLALDLGYIGDDEFKNIHSHVLSISKQLSGFMKYLKGSNLPNHKLVVKSDL